jgi:hypothetical protein
MNENSWERFNRRIAEEAAMFLLDVMRDEKRDDLARVEAAKVVFKAAQDNLYTTAK